MYVGVVFVLSYHVAEQVLDMNTAIRNERFNEGIFVSEILFFYIIYALLVLPW